MSTSAEVKIIGDNDVVDDYIHLYQHWDGDNLPIKVQTALRRGITRWGDAPYIARIIFTDMIRDHLDETTGYGISREGSESRVVIVDNTALTVTIGGHTWSFREYVEAPEVDLDFDAAEIAS